MFLRNLQPLTNVTADNIYLAEVIAVCAYRQRVDLGDWKNNTAYAEYSNFNVGAANTNYELLSVGTYSGTAGIIPVLSSRIACIMENNYKLKFVENLLGCRP